MADMIHLAVRCSTDVFQVPPSLLHDPSLNQLHAGALGTSEGPLVTGKSHSMSGAVHMAVGAGISRIHLITPTTADFHDVKLEGRSGILATCGRDRRPRWVSSKRRLGWPNGAVCRYH
jgi:hypothetical protein